MKNFLLALLVLLVISCKQEDKPTYSIIEGTVTNSDANTAGIVGNDVEARIPIKPNGSFKDTIFLKENGFYDLYVGRERTGVYLEKGKNLNVNIDASQFDESLQYSGDLGSINNFLAARFLWEEQHVNNRELFSANEADFLRQLDSNKTTVDSLYASYQISDSDFKKRLSQEDAYTRALMIENYRDAHRYYTGDEDFRVSGNFYDILQGIDYKDTLAFRDSKTYQNLLEAHYNRLVNQETFASGDNDHNLLYLKKVDASLPDGYAKNKLMSSFLQFGLKPDATLDSAYSIFINSNPDAENLAKITTRYEKLKGLTAGNPSPAFNYENHNGGTTTLDDLTGKYVYIDVWATWCGPCLREIPALKKVEREFHDKNIAFVSISIDEPKDYEKWKQMVKEKELGGIQLMADNNWQSKFVRDYAILGIPRFILIDPQGQIVSADAPRPSDPALTVMLNDLL